MRTNQACVCEEAEKLNFPVCPCLSGVEPGRDQGVVRTARPGGTLPLRHGFLEIEGSGIVLSGMKKAERSDAAIVRVFNPTGRAVTGALKFFKEVKTAEYVNMNEEAAGEAADVNGQRVAVTLPPKKVKTLMLTFHEDAGEAR